MCFFFLSRYNPLWWYHKSSHINLVQVSFTLKITFSFKWRITFCSSKNIQENNFFICKEKIVIFLFHLNRHYENVTRKWKYIKWHTIRLISRTGKHNYAIFSPSPQKILSCVKLLTQKSHLKIVLVFLILPAKLMQFSKLICKSNKTHYKSWRNVGKIPTTH